MPTNDVNKLLQFFRIKKIEDLNRFKQEDEKENKDIMANLPKDVDNAFMKALMDAENSIKKGYDRAKKKWFPHSSLEGGEDTVGYGSKLNKDLIIGGQRVDPYQGLSNEQVTELFKNDLARSYDIARNQFNKYSKTGVTFDQLNPKYRDVLTNIAYNAGTLINKQGQWGWPKLLKAIMKGDEEAIRKEMVTSYIDPKRGKIKLESRAQMIADALGLGKNKQEG